MTTENFIDGDDAGLDVDLAKRPNTPGVEKQIVPVTPDKPKINPGIIKVPPKEEGDEDDETPEEIPTLN